jgi:hypothetical protein
MQARVKVVAVIDDDASMLSAADNLLGAHGYTTLPLRKNFSAAERQHGLIAFCWILI